MAGSLCLPSSTAMIRAEVTIVLSLAVLDLTLRAQFIRRCHGRRRRRGTRGQVPKIWNGGGTNLGVSPGRDEGTGPQNLEWRGH